MKKKEKFQEEFWIENKKFKTTSYIAERLKAKYNKKEKLFLFNIDTIENNTEDTSVLIRGWGLCTLGFTPLQYVMKKEIEETARFKRVVRTDVNQIFSLNENMESGFEIEVKNYRVDKYFELVLKTENGVIMPVRVNKKKIEQVTFSEIIHNTKNDIKNEGIKEALRKFNYKRKTKEWSDFGYWIYKNENYDIDQVRNDIENFQDLPKISIVVPVYNVEERWLKCFINSVMNQYYVNWELCIADDCSPSTHVKKVLDEYQLKDHRIKVLYRHENGHISEATNSAISLVTGDYVGFMDNDDELSPFALYEYVKAINEDSRRDFIYCDEDKIDTRGKRFDPFFKSSWNRELLHNHNYITHFVLVKKSLLDRTGLLKSEYNGSQDYDFILRATENAESIHHIPKLLYHWRTIEGSVAFNPQAKMYCYEAGKKALEDSLERHHIKGKVELGKFYGTYKTQFEFETEPKITIIILLEENEISSVLGKLENSTEYSQIEFVFGIKREDASDQADEKYKNKSNIIKVYKNCDNNELKNYCAEIATGEYLLFLEKHVEIISGNWIEELINFSYNKGVGISGVKIVDAKNKILNVGMNFDANGKIRYSHQGCEDDGEYKGYYYRIVAPQYVFSVSDDCLLIKKDVFQLIGGYEKGWSFPLSAIDLCVKVKKQGYNVLFNPFVKVKQTYKHNLLEEKNELNRFKEKWSLDDLIDPYTNINLVKRELR